MSYEQQLARIQEMKASFTKGATNDLVKYEEFASKILNNWLDRSRKYHALLTRELCKPLSAGRFIDNRQYQVAREFALAALKEDAKAIPTMVEMDLVQHVSTLKPQPDPTTEEKFAERRLKDVQVRLHAWNRFVSTLDPNWDPNERIYVHPMPPRGIRYFNSGASPDAIKDPVMRAQYEKAVEENKQKIQKHTEQYMLRNRMKNFPREVESYIVKIYSQPPPNLSELKQLLDRYKIDDTTAERILKAVDAKANP